MGDAPDSREPAKRFEFLKKDFEIMQANVNSTLNQMRADMTAHREDAARRETRIILAMIAVVAIGFTVFGFVTAPH